MTWGDNKLSHARLREFQPPGDVFSNEGHGTEAVVHGHSCVGVGSRAWGWLGDHLRRKDERARDLATAEAAGIEAETVRRPAGNGWRRRGVRGRGIGKAAWLDWSRGLEVRRRGGESSGLCTHGVDAGTGNVGGL
jgi:hypothetical protein